MSYFKSLDNLIEGLSFSPDSWFDVGIDADLARGVFALTIGDAKVDDLPFAQENVHRTQCIGICPNAANSTVYIDRISVQIVPERTGGH